MLHLLCLEDGVAFDLFTVTDCEFNGGNQLF